MNDFGDYRIEGEESQYVGHIKSGALNQALIKRLTKISVSDDWEIAKHEWRATGQVWYRPLRYAETEIQQIPEPHCHDHPNKCVCGHPIAWHFEVENTENGILEILGSEHITNWMIVRHLKENKGIPADAITEEKIIEWMKEAVKTMKADWWWKENGEDWEEMFNHIKELDIRINVRSKGQYYDRETKRYEDHFTIAKTKSGSLGRMASVVWRWNHPDNPKNQQTKYGFPNDRLWIDMLMFNAHLEEVIDKLGKVEQNRESRIEQVEARKALSAEMRDEFDDEEFATNCRYYGIEPFDVNQGTNSWENKFLNDMRVIITDSSRELSDRQTDTLRKILMGSDRPASEKQKNYMKKLKIDIPDNLTVQEASRLIDANVNN